MNWNRWCDLSRKRNEIRGQRSGVSPSILRDLGACRVSVIEHAQDVIAHHKNRNMKNFKIMSLVVVLAAVVGAMSIQAVVSPQASPKAPSAVVAGTPEQHHGAPALIAHEKTRVDHSSAACMNASSKDSRAGAAADCCPECPFCPSSACPFGQDHHETR